MKIVRLRNRIVVEIIPSYALPVKDWYGAEFALQCIEAPNEVEQGWIYDERTKTFSEPTPTPTPQPTSEEDTNAMLIDHEYRLTLMELGV